MSRSPAPSVLPLFYRRPVALSSIEHAGWRLLPGDVGFSAGSQLAPVTVGEFAQASRDYPLLFVGESAAPVALLGLERDNLFVEDGRWARGAYVPAYVRRYPFGFAATGEPGRYVLTIDAASERVARSGEEGSALFEDGEPSALTRQALAFCDAFQSEAEATQAFSAALKDKDLLVDRRADATLPDGRSFGVEGFWIVDEARFAGLDDATAGDWHRKGWLALVHFHLASLDRFRPLLDRQGARGNGVTAAIETPPADAKAPPSGPVAKTRKA